MMLEDTNENKSTFGRRAPTVVDIYFDCVVHFVKGTTQKVDLVHLHCSPLVHPLVVILP